MLLYGFAVAGLGQKQTGALISSRYDSSTACGACFRSSEQRKPSSQGSRD